MNRSAKGPEMDMNRPLFQDDPIDSDTRLYQERRLHSLMLGLPAFEALLKSRAAHPFPLYVALCSLAGAVATLRSTYRLPAGY